MKRIAIVFAETDDNNVTDGQAFNVFLEGHDPQRYKLPEDQWTAAEFWALRCFQIVQVILKQTGAHQTSSRVE